MNKRVIREKKAYDLGSVYDNSVKLQKRFQHVFKCPNSLYAENYFNESVRINSLNNTVLDYGCYNGYNSKKILSYGAKKIIGIDISEKGIK